MPSIYGSDCDGPEPSYAELDAIIASMTALFPHALVGIGEYGKQGNTAILQYYMSYQNASPRYIFAGLYWYGTQDLVPKSQPLWQVFASLMR